MIHPVRFQLSRSKGFNLQAASLAINGLEAVNVARPARHGNPFTVAAIKDGMRGNWTDRCGHKLWCAWYRDGGMDALRTPFERIAARAAVDAYRALVRFMEDEDPEGFENFYLPLRDRNVACWCGLCAVHKKSGLPFGVSCAGCEPCHGDVCLESANG